MQIGDFIESIDKLSTGRKISKIVWGASGLYHDAALCIIKDNKLVFASSSERYSRIKNDPYFNTSIVQDALCFGYPDKIVWYETPWKKTVRNFICDGKVAYKSAKNHFASFNITSKIEYVSHHLSHLASALYTCPFDTQQSLGLVVDSVGEFDSLTVWDIKNKNNIKKLYTQYYPNSLGIFYSAITDLVGLKPLEEEYILMGMASYGKTYKYYKIFKNYFFNKGNLIRDCRYGCRELFSSLEIEKNKFDIALGAQLVFEENLCLIVQKFLTKTGYSKIIYGGGCALNCRANTLLLNLVDNIWIYPNPGDAGAAVGAALTSCNLVVSPDLMLGHDAGVITNIEQITNTLIRQKIVGVVNGKAEFGPRALGHRSILADPRDKQIQNRVNDIKGREQFRPFAPAVLKEYAEEYFSFKKPLHNYKYMQYLVHCTQPNLIPAVVHIDGTSRVQVVDQSNPFLYSVLTQWYKKTGCPVLLNTSLNIKGKPLINNIDDIHEIKDLSIISVHS